MVPRLSAARSPGHSTAPAMWRGIVGEMPHGDSNVFADSATAAAAVLASPDALVAPLLLGSSSSSSSSLSLNSLDHSGGSRADSAASALADSQRNSSGSHGDGGGLRIDPPVTVESGRSWDDTVTEEVGPDDGPHRGRKRGGPKRPLPGLPSRQRR